MRAAAANTEAAPSYCAETLLRVRMQYKQIVPVVRNREMSAPHPSTGSIAQFVTLAVNLCSPAASDDSPKMQNESGRLFVYIQFREVSRAKHRSGSYSV